MDEAEEIIGQPVKLMQRDSSFKKYVNNYSGQFQAMADEKNNLFYTITYHPDSVLAYNFYTETFKTNAGATEMQSLVKYGTEAFY
jgi:hypothetical protein